MLPWQAALRMGAVHLCMLPRCTALHPHAGHLGHQRERASAAGRHDRAAGLLHALPGVDEGHALRRQVCEPANWGRPHARAAARAHANTHACARAQRHPELRAVSAAGSPPAAPEVVACSGQSLQQLALWPPLSQLPALATGAATEPRVLLASCLPAYSPAQAVIMVHSLSM